MNKQLFVKVFIARCQIEMGVLSVADQSCFELIRYLFLMDQFSD